MDNKLDISAVVCTWNAVASIKECLESLIENFVKEIIVVDANSNDGTREIAGKIADQLLDDPRQGLALARNIGIAKCNSTFVINVGADNIMPKGSIKEMLAAMKQNNWAGISAVTLIKDSRKNYFSWAMNKYKIARYYPGERSVIGTPTIFETKLLQTNPYDPKMSWSDDGDLCTRLSKQGYKIGIANVNVYEIGTETLKSVFTRWRGYGKSDFETFSKYSPSWSVPRRIQSLLYPYVNELWKPFLKIKGISKFTVLPFLIIITMTRYYFWLQFTRKNKK